MQSRLNRFVLSAALGGLLVALATPSQAQTVRFFGQDNSPFSGFAFFAQRSFVASLGGTVVGAEEFEGFDTSVSEVPNPTLQFGGLFQARTSGGFAVNLNNDPNDPFSGPTVSSGVNSLDNFTSGAQTLTFNFDVHLRGFGLFLFDAGDPGAGVNNLTLTLSDTVTGFSDTIAVNPGGVSGGNFNVVFVGVSNATNTFNQVTLTSANAGDLLFVDGVTVGTTAPEPGALALMTGPALGLALPRLRRRNRA